MTTSSVFGLVTVPRYSAYCASKAAVLAYTDALRMELAAEDAPVTVSCVVPGGVRTGIVRAGSFAPAEDRDAVAARFETRIARTSPQQAAEVILAGVARRRRRILVGPDAHAAATLTRITGTGYQAPLVATLRYRSRRARP